MGKTSNKSGKQKTPFNLRVKEARELAKRDQEDLGKRVGISQQAVDKLENRPAKGSSYTAQIAAACGVSPYWLATGEGPREIKELPPEAMAIGSAWNHLKGPSRDRFAYELLNIALAFLPTTNPWYRTAAKLYREAAKRRGIKADLKDAA